LESFASLLREEAGVSRSKVRVRAASLDDLDAVLRLGEELHEPAASWPRPARLPWLEGGDGMRMRYRRLLADEDHRVVLAVDEDSAEPLGMAILGVDPASALLDLPAVSVTHLLVAPAHRRRGAGRALVTAAVGYADELGMDHIIVGVSTTGREANRFFARLGFAPLVVRRIATVAALRRTLGLTDPVAECRADAVRRRSRRGRALAATLPRPRPLRRS
jgi:GNAT superfamily N-acetyltransferase